MSQPKRRASNGHAQTAVTLPGVNKQFAKACPYCGGQVLGAITTNAGGGGTFGLSHGATPCPMVDALRDEVSKDGDFDPTVLLRVSGIPA